MNISGRLLLAFMTKEPPMSSTVQGGGKRASWWHYRISFHSVSLLLAGESHRKSYSDVARPTVVPSVGMIAQVLYNHG